MGFIDTEMIGRRYFEWMCRVVDDGRYFNGPAYWRLLKHLNTREFIFLMDMDGNRAGDGMNLRYRFGYEEGIDQREIAYYLDDRPCSVLEMMVALSIRCEEHIMSDPEMGDRTGVWFWGMISSLGLEEMTDDKYNCPKVDRAIDRFLNREYARNGKGGLFTIENCQFDMRSVEIWHQLNWYLSSIR